MGKNAIVGLIAVQYDVLNASDNKDRLRHIIAGVKDGRLFSRAGVDYGEWDGEDVEFITEDDTKLSRITASRLSIITKKMKDYFNPSEEVEEPEVEEKVEEKSTKEEELEVDLDEVIAECKKAIKKGKVKKANKLLKLLPTDLKAYKKLAKKIEEL